MATWKLTLEYDGTRYYGWQEQQNARTIAGELRIAAEDFFSKPVEIAGAGRTDAGVHALGQVARLRTDWRQKRVDLLHALNDRLPPDINVLRVEEARGGFDPRREPLETEILKEWEDDGVVCRIVRYRIGVFKRTKSMMAGIYAFPKGGKNLPGLVQVHGGGQSANSTTFMAGSTISPAPWRPCPASRIASAVRPISIIATGLNILSAAHFGLTSI